MKKILFVLKRKDDYGSQPYSSGISTGLFNSAMFLNDMLGDAGLDTNMVMVIDSNSIDDVITFNEPTHVIIEALWVSPEKMAELTKLHPSVVWIIRLHSELPFISYENMAMDWIGDYLAIKNVILAANSPIMLEDIRVYASVSKKWKNKKVDSKIIFLPNYYPEGFEYKKLQKSKKYIDVGCFGAVRPLKNHLSQALAAAEFADTIKKKLRFHINADRVEMSGGPALHNLMGMFGHFYDRGHRLVTHEWADRDDFLDLCSMMDMGMQVSFSETFNIVAADFVSQGIPLVCSDEIPWASGFFTADPTSRSDITAKLLKAYKYSVINIFLHQFKLIRYIVKSEKVWLNYFRD